MNFGGCLCSRLASISPGKYFRSTFALIAVDGRVCTFVSPSPERCFSTKRAPPEESQRSLEELVNRNRNRVGNIVRDIKHQKRAAGVRLKTKTDVILKDIIDTKSKVKERIEEAIERENIYTVPNFLCVSRIVMSPFLGWMILCDNYNIALGMWVIAGVSDLLDGWIARRWSSQSTKLGSFLDPMADKVLIGTLFLSLTYQGLIPLPLTALIIVRDVALLGAGFVIRYKSLSPPRTLSRYFDATHVTAQLAPTGISKINTAIQLLLVGSTLAAPVFNYVDHPVLQTLWLVTAASTVAAGFSYVISKNTYKYIKKQK